MQERNDFDRQLGSDEEEPLRRVRATALDRERRPFREADELDLASRLLEITSDPELDRLVGDLVSLAGGESLQEATALALRSALGAAARKIVPSATVAHRDALDLSPAPLGTATALRAGRIFGVELEGLSPEDQEFQVARAFVRFAGDTIARAALAQRRLEPRRAARVALVQAARYHAPGLLPAMRRSCGRRTKGSP